MSIIESQKKRTIMQAKKCRWHVTPKVSRSQEANANIGKEPKQSDADPDPDVHFNVSSHVKIKPSLPWLLQTVLFQHCPVSCTVSMCFALTFSICCFSSFRRGTNGREGIWYAQLRASVPVPTFSALDRFDIKLAHLVQSQVWNVYFLALPEREPWFGVHANMHLQKNKSLAHTRY